MKKSVNKDAINMIWKYNEFIYQDIFNDIRLSAIYLIYNIENSTSNSIKHISNNQHYSVIQRLIHKNMIKEIEKLKTKIKKEEL